MKSVQNIQHFSSGIVEPYIFISYSHDDDETVTKLAQHLEEEGFCIWIDYENIRGQYFSDDIKNGIRECTIFLQCLSKSYITKPYCEKEYKLADNENKGFVVVAIDNVKKKENPNAFPFGGNIYGFGEGIKTNFEGYWKSISKSALLMRLKQNNLGEEIPSYMFAGEQIITVLKEYCENTYQYSGNYVLSEIHRELFPDIIDESGQYIYSSEGTMEVSLLEFLKKDKEYRPILLKGAGGMGKTVSMIQSCKKLLDEGICAVYIPLTKVRFKDMDDPVKEYIRKHILGCDDSLFHVFESMANADIPNNVFLFLDGVNELAISDINKLYDFIKVAGFSREWIGTRIILASRVEIESLGVEILDVLPLEKNKICRFLEKLNVTIPTNEKVFTLISNPLMLGLYADAEKYAELYKKQGGRYKIRLEPVPDTATKIISNFMQTQLFQMASVSNNYSDFILYHVLIEYALPAVAYRMITSDYLLTERDVRAVLKETLDERDEHFKWYADVVLENFWWEYNVDEEYISRKDMKEIHDFALKKYRFLYVNNNSDYMNEPAVEFLHQEFRDYFAGVYFANEICMLEKNRKYVEDSYTDVIGLGSVVIGQEIMEYCAGILQEEKACPILEENGYVFPGKSNRGPSDYSVAEKVLHLLKHKEEEKNPGVSLVVANLMRILCFSRNNILAECDFSHLDLSRCQMNGCHFAEFYMNRIYSSDFDGAILNESFFLNAGHTDYVSAVAEGKDGWIYSVDEDGWLLAWNCLNNDIVRIKKYQGYPKELVYDLRRNYLCLVLEKQIILIDCDSMKEIYSKYNETDSKYFQYIKFDESGEVKYAYDLEPFRWFDLMSDEEEKDNLAYSVMTGCAKECHIAGKVIYTLYGKNICMLDYDEIKAGKLYNHIQERWLGQDVEQSNKRAKITAIAVNLEQSRFIVAMGNNVLEYNMDCDFNDSKPIWTYSARANIYDIKYLRNGGFVLAVGKQVMVLDKQGIVVNILHKQSVSGIVMFTPHSNGEKIEDLNDSSGEKEKYYLVSKEGAIKELDNHLNVTRVRKMLVPSRFEWVNDRRTQEVQMLFGPTNIFPNGYRFSFETGKAIPSGWCFEMKTTHYNMYRREYVINRGESAVVYDVRNKTETYEYKNHTGIWIFGCSFRDIRGQMARKESQAFLRKNGGIVNGI